MNGIELEDREFFAAIKDKREPNSSVAQCLPAMRRSTGWSASSTASARFSAPPQQAHAGEAGAKERERRRLGHAAADRNAAAGVPTLQ